MTRPHYLNEAQLQALTRAVQHGRVSRLTAKTREINHLQRYGLLEPGDLAGIWRPTTDGLSVAGHCPF